MGARVCVNFYQLYFFVGPKHYAEVRFREFREVMIYGVEDYDEELEDEFRAKIEKRENRNSYLIAK